ncbi:MAG TPA: Gfo/Idh/MocA family oxidoreductase, partial [Marmoricola sp.]|nr:Gfo/Idh/MocA family oxidoreductase [Marmoricola sp.]
MGTNAELDICLIGVGSMGRNHARVIAQHPRTRLATVVDPDEKTGRAVAAQYDATWAPTLENPSAHDAIVIATPTEYHLDVATRVIDFSVPLLIEKPLCPSFEQTKTLVDRAIELDIPLMCGLLERFNPAFMVARSMVEAPKWVRAERHSPYASRIKTGVSWDLLVHDVDLVIQLFNNQSPSDLTSMVGQYHPESVPGAEDVVECSLRFAAGEVATVSASRISQRKVRTMRIQELDRLIEIDLIQRSVTSYRHRAFEEIFDHGVGFRQHTEIEVPEVFGNEPLVTQLSHFVNLIEG